jgi:hypothetical protein
MVPYPDELDVATVAPVLTVDALELLVDVLDAVDLVEFDDELVVELDEPHAANVKPARPKLTTANRMFIVTSSPSAIFNGRGDHLNA